MVNSILTEKDQHNECFLFHSTVPCEPGMQDKIQIPNGNDETIFQANSAITLCISADSKINKRVAETLCRRVNGLGEYCQRAETIEGSTLSYWNPESNNFIYKLVSKPKFYEKPTLDNLRIAIENMRGHALLNNVSRITLPETGCELDKLQWINVFQLIRDTLK